MALVEVSLHVGEVNGEISTRIDSFCQRQQAAVVVADLDSNSEYTNIKHFPSLPSELVTLIFECAAGSSKVAAASLALVSHDARAIVLPLLFRTLVLHRRTTAFALVRFLHTHPYIAVHVREIWMRESTSSDAALLVPCTQVERLAVLPGCLAALCEYGEVISSSEPGRHAGRRTLLCTPHELLVFPGCVDWHAFDCGTCGGYTRSFFAGLTHLWLAQASQLRALLECEEACAALSRLTRLAAPLAGLPVVAVVQDILNTFPALQAFVVTPPTQHDPGLSRASVLVDPYLGSYLRDLHDERVYLCNAVGLKMEHMFLVSWKEDRAYIWDYVRTGMDRDR